MIVNLYTTRGCHLCDDALAMIERLRAAGRPMEICEVEISESESLMEAYGIRIPVVSVEGRDDELGWPFSMEQLETFIAEP